MKPLAPRFIGDLATLEDGTRLVSLDSRYWTWDKYRWQGMSPRTVVRHYGPMRYTFGDFGALVRRLDALELAVRR